MQHVWNRLRCLSKRSEGASLVEYGMLVGLIAAVAVSGVTAFGLAVLNSLYVYINNAI